ncbi:MAG: DUF3179 domain-containing protein [Gemmatimonadetes bacterium]|nr:DUF3179 domain-containing protein [Gemmatimonadota bacterium]
MRSFSRDVSPTPIGTTMAIAVLIASVGAPLGAQFSDRLEADPNMPVKEGFDTDRAIFWARPNFIPLRDPVFQSLRGARRAGEVNDQTTVVTFEVGGKTLVLVSSQMAYHHVAQGEIGGEAWMVTF